MNDEYDGGTIINTCPHCSQFCKIPEFYYVDFTNDSIFDGQLFNGCFADSYCKRCKKDVKLPVEFVQQPQERGPRVNWRTEKPDIEGWYWLRRLHPNGSRIEDHSDSIEYVRDYVGKMCIMNWEIPDNALWAGPIKPPVLK